MSENEMMKISQEGINLIKKWEGLMDGDPTTVNLDPYLCPAGVVTIGWGHAVYHNGVMLKGRHGLSIARAIYPDGLTLAEAENLLMEDITLVEAGVNRLTHVRLTQGQFDALVSFAFNLGLDEDKDGIAEGLGDSTLLKYVNRGQFYLAGEEFDKWVLCRGVKLNGLVNRRREEKAMFLKEEKLTDSTA